MGRLGKKGGTPVSLGGREIICFRSKGRFAGRKRTTMKRKVFGRDLIRKKGWGEKMEAAKRGER